MDQELEQLVEQTLELTGAPRPTMFDADSPMLAAGEKNGAIYLIGLIGGKDVGKSSLVNAIVGRVITPASSFGPGTENVIAYVHESAADDLQLMLMEQIPGRFGIVTHNVDDLRQQVLLDLPDIDSQYDDHVQITRQMLRHILYPLWIQSVEKYADQQPQQLLAAVTQGNDPVNFIFCLNKADQIEPQQAQMLRQDFAQRLARVTGLSKPPRVQLISAVRPRDFDLPALRQLLSQQRPQDAVQQSRSLAQQQQKRSVLRWIGQQRLPQKADQLGHMHRDAEEITAARLAPMLLDQAIPRLLDDPGQRMAMFGPAMRLRLSRWPIVNAIDALMSPVMLLVQKNLGASTSGSADPDVYLDRPGAVAGAVQAAFSQLQQLHPETGTLYRDRKLWEDLSAETAAADLRSRFATALERQREAILQRVAGRWQWIFAPLRWLLTIGAVIWFPLAQPLLSAGLAWDNWRNWLFKLVELLSVAHLLSSTTFLLIWFAVLWVLLRFSAYRRVTRLIDRWKRAGIEDELSLAGQTMLWIEQLLDPIVQQRQRVDSLLARIEQISATSPAASPSAPVRAAG